MGKPSKNIFDGRFKGYRPLGAQEIRLVELHPGAADTIIQLQLRQNVALSRNHRYTALSYTWGNPNETEAVLIGSEEVWLTKSLVSFLHHQRKPLQNEFHLLWIDAISINQVDLSEKTQQIPLMRHIYQSSVHTLIWLGAAREDTETVLDFLTSVVETVPRSYNYGYGDPDATKWLQDEDNKVLFKEFILSDTVRGLCGDHSIKLSNIDLVYRLFAHPLGSALMEEVVRERDERERRLSIGHIRRSAEMIRYLRLGWKLQDVSHSSSEAQILVELLWQFRDNGATDARDKIYGLLGLVETIREKADPETKEAVRMESPSILVSYEAPVSEVYKSVVRAVLYQTQSIDILTACQGNRMAGIPNWTPDWSQPWNGKSLLYAKMTSGSRRDDVEQFSATKLSTAKFRFSDDGKMLYVYGIRIDQVMDIWKPLYKKEGADWVIDSKNCTKHYLGSAQKWRSRQPRGVYQTRAAAYEAHWKSLLAFDVNGTTVTDQEASVAGYERWMAGADDPWSFVRSTATVMRGRQTMISKKGHIIAGPENTKMGDYLCLLLGCSVPVILRPHWTRWEFVGECYTVRLMNGDFMESLSTKPEEFGLV